MTILAPQSVVLRKEARAERGEQRKAPSRNEVVTDVLQSGKKPEASDVVELQPNVEAAQNLDFSGVDASDATTDLASASRRRCENRRNLSWVSLGQQCSLWSKALQG